MEEKVKIIPIRTMIIIFFITLLTMSLTVKAGYQANKGENSVSATADNLFIGIRKMESGVLNKQMELDEKNGTYKDSSGNGIDCHMILNTEWGTAAMLAQSAYGGSPTVASDTTTKNESGIYYMVGADNSPQNTNDRWEFVAGIYGGASNGFMQTISKADPRYYNSYTTDINKTYKGDTLREITWLSGPRVGTDYPVFTRGYKRELFGFCASNGNIALQGEPNQYLGSRAAVVCGVGL